MFYFFVGLAVAGYLIFTGLMKIKIKPLVISCPCTLVIATTIALVSFITDHNAIAWIAIFGGLYLLSITLLAIRKSNIQNLNTVVGVVEQS